MKRTLKIVSLCIAIVLLTQPLVAFDVVEPKDDGTITLEEFKEISKLETPARKAYEEIVDSWIDESNTTQYPDDYGGCFIDDDYKLTVKLVNNSPELRKYILDVVTNDSAVKFESTDISLSGLKTLQESATSELEKYDISSGISQRNSTVEITIYADDGVHNIAYNEVLSNPHINIEFKETIEDTTKDTSNSLSDSMSVVPTSTAATTAYPGGKVEATSGGTTYSGSIGWFGKAYLNGVQHNVMLTAGHVVAGFVELGADVTINGTTILSGNRLTNSNYVYYNYVYNSLRKLQGDYGFVVFSGITPSYNSMLTSGTSTTMPVVDWELGRDVLEGQTVCKGKGESGYQTAEVVNIDTQYEPKINTGNGSTESILVQGLVSVSNGVRAFADCGDSGDVVCLINGDGKLSFCGIISGTPDPDGTIAVFTPTALLYGAGFVPIVN